VSVKQHGDPRPTSLGASEIVAGSLWTAKCRSIKAPAAATYERLFGPRDKSAPDSDPELMEILRRFIFGDVFDTRVCDWQRRHASGQPHLDTGGEPR
jgi:hypothetical protein